MLLLTQQESLRQIENRPVYPYSIVAGGVRDASELKWAAEHDPVVRSHYAGFDYDHARVVRLVLARSVSVQPATGTAVASPPLPFQSALLNRPAMPGLGPAPPLSLYDPFGSGTWVPISPPPLPGVCGVGKNKNGSGAPVGTGKKGKGNPCGNGGGGGEVPEPGTWLLVASGLAAMYWKTRQRFART